MRFQAALCTGCFVAIAALAAHAQTQAPGTKKPDVVIVLLRGLFIFR
jgi:hypothetical protein